MAYQNINQYVFNKLFLKPVREVTDISLTSDENNFDKEVVFSPYIIADTDGNRMPLKFDFSSDITSQCISCGDFESDVIVSENYWNPENINLESCGKLTNLCDVGLTGIDNGLVQNISGETIQVNSGLYIYDSQIYNRYFYDRRFKMHPITGFTTVNNRILSDNSYSYDISAGDDGDDVGQYVRLNGGFYQGFYKLSEYDYEVLPERFNWGWSAEFLMRYRWTGDTNVGLNYRYPDNKGTFFFYGSRAENKFYHFANGEENISLNGTWKLYVQDFEFEDSGSIGSLSLTLCNTSGCTTFDANEDNILIPDLSVASVYPITFTVSGITNPISRIYLTINDYYHSYPEDVGMLLVSPTGIPTIIAGREYVDRSYDPISATIDSSATTLWNGFSAGTFINNSYAFFEMPFSSPCPYQYEIGDTTNNISIFVNLEDFRVTDGLDCIKTCGCSDSANTASTCSFVYQQSAITTTNCSCSCACDCVVTGSTGQLDPLYDSVSNALSVRFSGDSGNPRICVKTYRITGGCETTGSCETTGLTYTTGTSLTEWCSTGGIFDSCINDSVYFDDEHWVQIDVVFVRNKYLEECDLQYKGGLKEIVKDEYVASLENNSISLIQPPLTQEIPYDPPKEQIVKITERWIDEEEFRKGKLKVYVNGKLFFIIDDFEEIIPRPLNTEKEKQIGVPFNISLGGGTQGLHDNLTFSGCPENIDSIFYQQDPELLPTVDLSKTQYAGLTTNIYLSEYFGGSFIGDISAFRFYTEPLDASQIGHNFRILKDRYNLLDPNCPICSTPPPSATPSNTPTPTTTPTPTITPFLSQTPTPSITTTKTPTPTKTPTNTPTQTTTPTNTPSFGISPSPTETPTQTPTFTPSPTKTPASNLRAYLLIEPFTGNTSIGQWMYNSGSNFFGFTNESQPTQDPTTFNIDMNVYVDFSGWTSGEFPLPIQQVVPQISGGVDEFDNPIVAYNFKTTEVPANTVSGGAWYTWIIPNILTNNKKQVEIDLNNTGNPNLLTAIRTESTIYQYSFTYTGSTIQNTTYSVYTTYPNLIFKLNNTQNIYFRGNSVL